jgi:pimeloyl-ACP methyl ester carboxylesterase
MPSGWHKLEKRKTSNFRRLHTLAGMGLLNRTAKLFGERATPAHTQNLPKHIQAMYRTPQYFATNLAEQQALIESEAQVKASGLLGDMPLIVIRPELSARFSQLSDEQATQAEQVWHELQDQLVNLSTNSKLVVVEGNGHNIPLEQPDVVVAAIREAVETIRRGRPLEV